MTLREKITKLAEEKGGPCVTISLNTHRTHPDSAKDGIVLKNLLSEAEKRVIEEFGKRPAAALLDKINYVADKIDVNYSLDSLHIFLSNDTEEIIKIAWSTYEDRVDVGESFDLRSVIKASNRVEEYLVLLLSQGGVHLYYGENDSIVGEIENDDFPFDANPHFITDTDKRSDSKLMDNQIREFFNTVDKAVVRITEDADLKCIVICTEDNYSKLLQVADKPDIYTGFAHIDYNHIETHQIVKQSWEIIKKDLYKRRTEAIAEMKEAIGQSKVLTDLQEIYQAAIDGRGDLLIVYEDFSQPVKMTGDRTFERVDDAKTPGIVDDITSEIVWQVLSKKGRVFFTRQDEIKDLGEIVLKVRY